MKILYQIPSLNTITAGRIYYHGFKHAFEDLGHTFRHLTADDDASQVLRSYKPDILITGLNHYLLKYLDLDQINKLKKKNLRVFANVPHWTSPFSKLRVTENQSLKDNQEYIQLIKSGRFGDFYFNSGEQGDPRMDGFEKTTGYPHITIPLAADKTLLPGTFNPKYECDLSFIGTYLPGRREFMKKYVFPLKRKYNMKLYCHDLHPWDGVLNFTLKVGQYFNIPVLRSFKKNNVTFEQERDIFKSSTICLNIHEDNQKETGMDCNDRTFKVPLLGGFEITDNVACIRKYFKADTELVIARDGQDWLDKIAYYIEHPEKRQAIIEAGRKRVLKEHTYHNRVEQMIKLYNS